MFYHWKSTLSATRLCCQSEQVSRNWTIMSINGCCGKRAFWCKMGRPVVSTLSPRRIAIGFSKTLVVCLVLNKDFARNRWYNHRISSWGKGSRKSPCPHAPRKPASRWDQIIQDISQLSCGWLPVCSFHSFCSSVCPCVLCKFFALVSDWTIPWCVLWLLSIVLLLWASGKDPARLDRNRDKKSRRTFPLLCQKTAVGCTVLLVPLSTVFSSNNKF